MTTRAAQHQSNESSEYSILDGIIAETRLTPNDEAYDIAKRGVSAFIGEPVKKAMVDRMIAEIDAKLSQQMDEILHHEDFQSLESAWRGLQLLVERTNFRENIKIEILNVSKQDLLDDFEDSPEVMQAGVFPVLPERIRGVQLDPLIRRFQPTEVGAVEERLRDPAPSDHHPVRVGLAQELRRAGHREIGVEDERAVIVRDLHDFAGFSMSPEIADHPFHGPYVRMGEFLDEIHERDGRLR